MGIKAGTRVILEHALIALPAPGDDVEELFGAFEALTSAEQESILLLKPAPASSSEFLTTLAKYVHGIVAPLWAIENKPMDQRTEQEQEYFDKELPWAAYHAAVFRVTARWYAHSRSLAKYLSMDELTQPATPISAIFIKTARLRHSCIPNCYMDIDPTTKAISIYATTDVSAGTELTLSSIKEIYVNDAAARATLLEDALAPPCTCSACDSSHPQFLRHERTRLILKGTAAIMEERLKRIPPSLDHLDEIENTIMAMINMLKQTGCTGLEPVAWYNHIFEDIHPRKAVLLELAGEHKLVLEYHQLVLRHATDCALIGARCLGANHMQVMRMKERCRGLVEVVKMARERVAAKN
jgi:hypothetical protein